MRTPRTSSSDKIKTAPTELKPHCRKEIFTTFAPQIAKSAMEQLDYSIPLRRLPNGDHKFNFECGDDLFGRVENALVEHGHLYVEVAVHKNDEMMTLDFAIGGTLRLQCDVCLGWFDYPIEDCEERVTLKLGNKFEEIGDDLYEVDAAEERLDLSQWIYEMASVMIPLRCEHPLDDDGNPTCDPTMLAELEKYVVRSEEDLERKKREAQENSGDVIDPRWAALKQLKGDD